MIMSAEELIDLHEDRKVKGWYGFATRHQKTGTYAVFDGGELIILYTKGKTKLYHKSRTMMNFKNIHIASLQDSITGMTKGKQLTVSEDPAVCTFLSERIRSVEIPLS